MMRYIVLFLLLCIFALELFYIYLTNEYVPKTVFYAQLQEEIQVVRRENSLLKEAILTNESLLVIAQKAKKRGFVPMTIVVIGSIR